MEAVFRAMIFGIKSASALSEQGKAITADHCKVRYPAVATMLEESTYVDDLGESKPTMAEIEQLEKDADTVFEQVGMKVKEWNKSGRKS